MAQLRRTDECFLDGRRGRLAGHAILLREPFRTMNEKLIGMLAARGHPEVRYAHGSVFQFLDDAGTRVSVLAERAQITKQAMAQLFSIVREFLAEIDARLAARLGEAKVRLRALLQDLNEAL